MSFPQEDKYGLMLKISIVIVVMSSYLALTAVRAYGIVVLFIPILPLLLNFFVEKIVKKYPRYPFFIQIPLWMVSLSLPVLIMLIGILDTVLLLTIFIQLTLLARPKGLKEYLYIILMSFFLLLGAGVQAPEFVVGVSLIFFICFVFILLPIVTMVHGKDEKGGNVSVPLSSVKRSFPKYKLYLTIAILLNVLAGWFLIILSFLFIPRLEAGIFGHDVGNLTRTGITTTVSLKGGQSIEVSYTPVMSVYIPTAGTAPPIQERQLYWRITSLPTYLGIQWRRWPLEESYESVADSFTMLNMLKAIEERKKGSNRKVIFEMKRDFPSTTVTQEIYLDSIPEDGVPVLDRVREFRTQESGARISLSWDMTKDYTVAASTNNARRLVYTAVSELITWDREKLMQAAGNYRDFMSPRDYDVLTQHDLSPEVQSQIQRVVEGKGTIYEKVEAIEKWLSGPEFQYTLDIPPLPGDHPMNAFFTEVRRGHCELFASAMALAVRSLGIPARVVTGYLGGEWDPQNHSYLVREGMAHLWVEVLFPQYGWVPFDPSPMPDPNYLMKNLLIARLSRWMLQTRMFWYQRVIGFEQGFQLPNFGTKSIGFIRGLDDYINPGRNLAIPSVGIIFVIAMLIFLLFLAGLLWQVSKKAFNHQRVEIKKLQLTKDQMEARKLFKKLESVFARNNWKIQNLTAEEIKKELPDKVPLLCSDIQPFLEEYNLIRFGLKPWDDTRRKFWRRKIREWRNKKLWKTTPENKTYEDTTAVR